MTTINLALHSYTLRLHFLYDDGYDVFKFIDDAASLGFSGVNISLAGPDNDRLPPHRHLGGDTDEHLENVAAYLRKKHLSVEVDTDGTDTPRLMEAIRVARALNASVVRTFTHHEPGPEMFDRTLADLQNIAGPAQVEEVVIALENHEEFTADELVKIMKQVPGHSVLLLYDFGNGLPVLEDPADALEKMKDWVVSCHMKDCIIVKAEDGPLSVPCSMGVPLGRGAVDLAHLTKELVNSGLHRITLQNVWGYHVPFGKLRIVDTSDPRLGTGPFQYAQPPFDVADICFDPEDTLNVSEMLQLERQALKTAYLSAKNMMARIGFTLQVDERN